jgi:hypothetical protein
MPFAEGTPTVEIMLGGKSYTLGWTWGAKRRLKERLAMQGSDLKDVNAISENLPAVLWAALDNEARDSISVEGIEELVNPRNEAEVVEKISSLFAQSEPDPEVKAEPAAVKRPTAGNSTSMKSEQLASTT